MLKKASVDVRPRFPALLVEKLKARASQTGYSIPQLIHHYVLLGMRAEDELPAILPKLGNVSLDTPKTSRKLCKRYYLDSDLIKLIKQTPEGLISESKFVNDTVRDELVRRKNSKEDKNGT
jgi:hypothetical protein